MTASPNDTPAPKYLDVKILDGGVKLGGTAQFDKLPMTTQLIDWPSLERVGGRLSPAGDDALVYRDVICRIRQQRPWMFDLYANVNQPTSFPAINRNIWDRICDARPLPPEAQERSPWIGGQCATLYNVSFFVRDANGNVTQGSEQLNGPLQQLYFERTYPYVIAGRNRLRGFVRGADGVLRTPLDYIYDDPAQVTKWTRVVRVDGMPDNCGDATPDFGIPPTPPPNMVVLPDVVIGGQERPITVEIPGFEPGNWPDFEFEPEFIIDGTPVRITPEGLEIDYAPNFTLVPPRQIPAQLEPQFNTVNNALSTINNSVTNISNSLASTTIDISELRQLVDVRTQAILDELEECCADEQYQLQLQPITLSTTGNRFPLPDDCVAVRVELAGDATSATPGQTGPGGSAVIRHWGWVAIGYGIEADGVRQYLHYEDQAVPCLEFAKSVTVAPTYGNTAKVSAIVKVLIE